MPQTIVNSFTSGELSPRLAARTDFDKYRSGCKRLRNFFIMPQGGVYGRPGTRFVRAVRNSAAKCRILSFEFSSEQAYILEMGDTHFRFYKDGGIIMSGTPVEVAHPWAESELFDVKCVQTADTMYFAHPNKAPYQLTRTSHTSWTLSPVAFKDGPYMPANGDTAKTLVSSVTAVGAAGTLTAAGHTPFVAGHVGSFWQISDGTTTGYVEVTSYTSSTVVNITVKKAVVGTAQWKWREGAFSSYRGWPRGLGFVEERLFFTATNAQPLTIWGSVNGDFVNHQPGVDDDDAVEYTVASGYVNPIHWLVEDRGLFIGNTKSEMRLGGGNDAPLSPSNARVLIQTTHGSKSIQPLRAGNSTIFVQRAGLKVRSLQYNFNSDSYVAPDLTLFAQHITQSGVVDWAYQQEPESLVHAALSNGKLASMTYLPDQQVVGWALHDTDGSFESVACIPAGETDQVWTVVKRTINGSTVRYIEYFDPRLHMDCALSYTGAPVTTVSGLGHLQGKTVSIVGDGAAYTNSSQPVSVSGIVSFSPAASAVDVGLPFTPELVTLRPEIPDRTGSLQGRKKRWVKIGVRLLDTLGVTINGDQVESRSSDDVMDAVPGAISGDVISVNTGWDRDGEIAITQTQPLPITVLGLFGTLESGE